MDGEANTPERNPSPPSGSPPIHTVARAHTLVYPSPLVDIAAEAAVPAAGKCGSVCAQAQENRAQVCPFLLLCMFCVSPLSSSCSGGTVHHHLVIPSYTSSAGAGSPVCVCRRLLRGYTQESYYTETLSLSFLGIISTLQLLYKDLSRPFFKT